MKKQQRQHLITIIVSLLITTTTTTVNCTPLEVEQVHSAFELVSNDLNDNTTLYSKITALTTATTTITPDLSDNELGTDTLTKSLQLLSTLTPLPSSSPSVSSEAPLPPPSPHPALPAEAVVEQKIISPSLFSEQKKIPATTTATATSTAIPTTNSTTTTIPKTATAAMIPSSLDISPLRSEEEINLVNNDQQKNTSGPPQHIPSAIDDLLATVSEATAALASVTPYKVEDNIPILLANATTFTNNTNGTTTIVTTADIGTIQTVNKTLHETTILTQYIHILSDFASQMYVKIGTFILVIGGSILFLLKKFLQSVNTCVGIHREKKGQLRQYVASSPGGVGFNKNGTIVTV